MSFDPAPHMIKLPQRYKDQATGEWRTRQEDYLEVKWRIVLFRDKYPHGQMWTEAMTLDWDTGVAIFKATVQNGEGGSATGWGTEIRYDKETKKGFEDFVEKAETRAVGRALGMLGMGTQFIGDELSEAGHVADNPVVRPDAQAEPVERPTKAHLKALGQLAMGDCGEDSEVFEDRVRRLMGWNPAAVVTVEEMAQHMSMAQYMEVNTYYVRLKAQQERAAAAAAAPAAAAPAAPAAAAPAPAGSRSQGQRRPRPPSAIRAATADQPKALQLLQAIQDQLNRLVGHNPVEALALTQRIFGRQITQWSEMGQVSDEALQRGLATLRHMKVDRADTQHGQKTLQVAPGSTISQDPLPRDALNGSHPSGVSRPPFLPMMVGNAVSVQDTRHLMAWAVSVGCGRLLQELTKERPWDRTADVPVLDRDTYQRLLAKIEQRTTA